MEKQRSGRKLEPEIQPFEYPKTDVYVQFGHSIEQYRDGSWHLTRLLQAVKNKDEFDKETGYPWPLRTAKYSKIDKKDKEAIAGGGIFVTAALVDAYESLKAEGEAPKLIIHCGGKPLYIENFNASEGEIM